MREGGGKQKQEIIGLRFGAEVAYPPTASSASTTPFSNLNTSTSVSGIPGQGTPNFFHNPPSQFLSPSPHSLTAASPVALHQAILAAQHQAGGLPLGFPNLPLPHGWQNMSQAEAEQAAQRVMQSHAAAVAAATAAAAAMAAATGGTGRLDGGLKLMDQPALPSKEQQGGTVSGKGEEEERGTTGSRGLGVDMNGGPGFDINAPGVGNLLLSGPPEAHPSHAAVSLAMHAMSNAVANGHFLPHVLLSSGQLAAAGNAAAAGAAIRSGSDAKDQASRGSEPASLLPAKEGTRKDPGAQETEGERASIKPKAEGATKAPERKRARVRNGSSMRGAGDGGSNEERESEGGAEKGAAEELKGDGKEGERDEEGTDEAEREEEGEGEEEEVEEEGEEEGEGEVDEVETGSDDKEKRGKAAVRAAVLPPVGRGRVPKRRRSARIAERVQTRAWRNNLAWSWMYSAVAAANTNAEGGSGGQNGGGSGGGGEGGGATKASATHPGPPAAAAASAAVAAAGNGAAVTASGRAARRSVTALANAPVLRHSGAPGIMLMLQPSEVAADFLAITGQPPPPAKKAPYPKQHFIPFQVRSRTLWQLLAAPLWLVGPVCSFSSRASMSFVLFTRRCNPVPLFLL